MGVIKTDHIALLYRLKDKDPNDGSIKNVSR